MSNPIVTVIVLLISSFSFAQNSQTITLEKAIEKAKTNNIDLKIADKEIEKQTVLKKTAFQVDPLQVQYQGGQFKQC
jgi:cobalt-zinc-cadmium resistance protein CzcA